jgi:hypothetical protein
MNIYMRTLRVRTPRSLLILPAPDTSIAGPHVTWEVPSRR